MRICDLKDKEVINSNNCKILGCVIDARYRTAIKQKSKGEITDEQIQHESDT